MQMEHRGVVPGPHDVKWVALVSHHLGHSLACQLGAPEYPRAPTGDAKGAYREYWKLPEISIVEKPESSREMLLDAGEVTSGKPHPYLKAVNTREVDRATVAQGKLERLVGKCICGREIARVVDAATSLVSGAVYPLLRKSVPTTDCSSSCSRRSRSGDSGSRWSSARACW